jgi:glucosamine 6-phosphate synthetase-like amidotransferase/phosphosugar isomerase protein
MHRVPHHLGYGFRHRIALEETLKPQEITYAHCEGIFSSEFKHGPLPAAHVGYPMIFITAFKCWAGISRGLTYGHWIFCSADG